MTQSFTTLLNSPEHLQRALKKAPALVSLVLVIACAHVLAQMTWALLSEPEDETSFVTKSMATKGSPKSDNQQAFRQLTAANLFGIVGETKTTATKAPETKLNLVLKGVLATDPMKAASAIIAQGKNGKEEIYGVGDKLPGGVTIKEIYPEYVILERNGQLETLRLPQESELFDFTDTTPDHDNTQSDFQAESDSPADTLNNIRENIMKNPTSFAEYALPIVVKEDGKQIGYRLQPQKQGELLAEIGLEPSDVIISINGVSLDDPKNGISALRDLSTATDVNITVLRNGAEVPLNIQLQ